MYREDAFVCQAVWSNNEDGVSLGNKTYAVMSIDSLANNIISDDFTDDDEELFDANEFYGTTNPRRTQKPNNPLRESGIQFPGTRIIPLREPEIQYQM